MGLDEWRRMSPSNDPIGKPRTILELPAIFQGRVQ
jgi:hypothetical protein